jgi:hypothetical protein
VGHRVSRTALSKGERMEQTGATRTVEERTVLLYDTPCTITISHASKTVWIAAGDYRGGRIEVKGSSANNAAKYWVDAARFSGN